MSDPSRFLQDTRSDFCELVGVELAQLTPLLQWLKAPPNLQQFRPVISNLIELFGIVLPAELAEELELSQVPIDEWRQLLISIKASLPNKLPKHLACLEANGTTRPDGLIGGYPIYASLTAWGVLLQPEQEISFRFVHLIGLACAVGYQKQIDAGEISTPTGGIASGMLDIRTLELPKKRPSEALPEFHVVANLDLDSFLEELEAWIHDNHEGAQRSWGKGLRLLVNSFAEEREGSLRQYRMRIKRNVRRVVHELVEDEPGQNIVRAPTSITRYFNHPDQRSTTKLKKIGLHPDEMSAEKFVVIEEPDAPPITKINQQVARQRQRGRLQSMIRSAQELPDDWGTPTAYEIEYLMRALNGDQTFRGVNSLCSSAACNCLLYLRVWTGLPLAELTSLLCIQNKSKYLQRSGDPKLVWLEDESLLALPIHTPARQRGIDAIDRALLQRPELGGREVSQQSVLYVQLPKKATEAINRFVNEWRLERKRRNETGLFREDLALYEDAIGAYLKSVNAQHATRWTQTRLSLILRNAILKCSGDQVFTHLLTRQDIGHASVAAHYQCTDLFFLESLLYRAHEQIQLTARGLEDPRDSIEPPTTTAPRVGSLLAVSNQFVRELSQHLKLALRGELRQSPSEEHWIATHNLFVSYIVHWLGFCSGYRAVVDPLHDPRQLDRQSGLLVISDKDDDVCRHSRVVCLPRSFIEQLDLYIEHLLTLANKLTRNPVLQDKIRILCRAYQLPHLFTDQSELPLPFFFLLNEQLRTKVVSPRTLREFNPTRLPPNIDRHFLRSQLSAMGAPPECVDYFMGHWERGEEPYIKHAMISPLRIASLLQQYLEDIHKACGWRIQPGLRGG